MNYYLVIAKCGHVGRHNYIIKEFYVKAETGEDAAAIVRAKPRVKHHRKDAIQSVKKISYEAYLQGLKDMNDDDYFKVHNKQQQIKCCAVDELEVMREIPKEPDYKKTHKRQHLKYAMMDKEWKKYQARR